MESPEEIDYPPYQTMCELRMKSDGRGKEFKDRMADARSSTPEGKKFHWSNSRTSVLKQMGMKSPDEEKALYRERSQQGWLADHKRREEEQEAEKKIKKMRDDEKRRQKSFEKAVSKLPVDAKETDVLSWISAHTAMSRQDRASDKTQIIHITAEDITHSDAGKCPSMKAARDLQHWANNPSAFRKDYHAMMHKASAIENKAESYKEENDEDSLSDEYKQDTSSIRRMLSSKDEES